MSGKYIILDLDNCISDDQWRLPYIRRTMRDDDPFKYYDYHSCCAFDQSANRHLFLRSFNVIVFTTRPQIFRAVTQEWLTRHDVLFEYLLMRGEGDFSPGVNVKRNHLLNLLATTPVTKENIFCAYDDRAEIVDMYLQEGLPAQMVSIY